MLKLNDVSAAVAKAAITLTGVTAIGAIVLALLDYSTSSLVI